MCGINGLLRLHPGAPSLDPEELLATRERMARRGPDGAGSWLSPSGTAALAHRRLAILDLSATGAQPMLSKDGRYALVLNGEIYNFRALRRELEAQGASFRGSSDTEVVLELFARQGPAMLGRLRGMFALAIWDEVEQALLLARDPLGIKPLYYQAQAGVLRFASLVRALAAPGPPAELEPAGLVGFLLWGSVPEPWTLHRGLFALPAGHFLRIETGENTRTGLPAPARYGFPGPADADPGTSLGVALEESVEAHLVSDVPVAVFLSAGLDSSLIAALAARRTRQPLTTFTVSFDLLAGTALDEAALARQTARRLKADHREERLGRDGFGSLWRECLEAMDQPSIDGFNTFVVSRLARQAGIKVVLSGLGGDELLGSYPSFADVPRWLQAAQSARRIPGLARLWPRLSRPLAHRRPKLPGLLRYASTLAGAYFLRRALFLPEELPDLLGAELAAAGLARYDPVADAAAELDASSGRLAGGRGAEEDPWLAVHGLESALYMRRQLLRDADWAAMAHSLELRVPLADAWLLARFELERLRRGRQPAPPWGSKRELVRKLAPELPEELWSRPKTGFYLPLAEWLNGRRDPLPASERGRGSRRLALTVLKELGIDLDGARATR